MGLFKKKDTSKNFAARIVSWPGFQKTSSDRLTVSEGYYASSCVAWAPHRGGDQQSQHFKFLDHGVLIRAHGSKDERFTYFFTEESQHCPAGLKTSIHAAVRSQDFLGIGGSWTAVLKVLHKWQLSLLDWLLNRVALMRKLLRQQWAVFNVLRSCAVVKFARMVFSCSTADLFKSSFCSCHLVSIFL